ncbi:MAG TPA: AarF/UbiB family protein [Acidimicrobiales bacterium]|nr:AarF/UbiB family protein [Acidimicrobiales bacterium]
MPHPHHPPAIGPATRSAIVGRSARTAEVLLRHGARFARRARAEDRAAAGANELRRAFEDLGPTYVKLAQLIASSPGLFPDVLADEFRACLDEVPPVDADDIIEVITSELGAHPDTLFACFERKPLASASIAQVHAAELRDGTDVVVKVQRPGIAPRLQADLAILERIARLLERTSAKGRMANPVAVVEDFATTLAQELNFVIEARAMERFETNLRAYGSNDNVRVPAVHWPLTTPRVLTMERIHGYKIDDLAQLGTTGWDLAGALKRGVRAWMEAALQHGLFHGDVHAGNLMLDTDGNIVFLDFGICGTLDDATRTIVRTGLPALLIDKDFQTVATAIYQMGAVLRPADLEQSARDIAEIVEPILGRPLSEISYGQVLIDIVRIGTRYEVRLPRELVLVAKQMLYFERYAKLMAPDWAILNDPELIGFLFDTVHTGDT